MSAPECYICDGTSEIRVDYSEIPTFHDDDVPLYRVEQCWACHGTGIEQGPPPRTLEVEDVLADLFNLTADEMRTIMRNAERETDRRIAWHLKSVRGRLDEHGPRKPRSLVPTDELPDATWRTQDGDHLKVSEMDDQHLVNTYLMVMRANPQRWQFRRGLSLALTAHDDIGDPLIDEWTNPANARRQMVADPANTALRAHVARRRLWRMVANRIGIRTRSRAPQTIEIT